MARTESFCGTAGTFLAVVRGGAAVSREEIWLKGVGLYLRALQPPKTKQEIVAEYNAAGVGSRSANGVFRKVLRFREKKER